MNRRVLAGLAMMITIAFGVKADAAGWETDFAKASINASKSDLYMLLDFSGSDWCGWCMKLDGEVFSKGDFKKFAKENLVCVLVDFPRLKNQSKKLKEQNAELAKEYSVQGYPTVIILSPEGDLVGRTGYQEGGAKKYVENLKKMIDEYKKTQCPIPANEQEAEMKRIREQTLENRIAEAKAIVLCEHTINMGMTKCKVTRILKRESGFKLPYSVGNPIPIHEKKVRERALPSEGMITFLAGSSIMPFSSSTFISNGHITDSHIDPSHPLNDPYVEREFTVDQVVKMIETVNPQSSEAIGTNAFQSQCPR